MFGQNLCGCSISFHFCNVRGRHLHRSQSSGVRGDLNQDVTKTARPRRREGSTQEDEAGRLPLTKMYECTRQAAAPMTTHRSSCRLAAPGSHAARATTAAPAIHHGGDRRGGRAGPSACPPRTTQPVAHLPTASAVAAAGGRGGGGVVLLPVWAAPPAMARGQRRCGAGGAPGRPLPLGYRWWGGGCGAWVAVAAVACRRRGMPVRGGGTR